MPARSRRGRPRRRAWLLALASRCLAARGRGAASVAPAGRAARATLVARGRQLFLTGCSGCHGARRQGLDAPDGTVRGPSLTHAGEAGAYYYLLDRAHAAGRPATSSRCARTPPTTTREIDALVAYVGSLGRRPRDPAGADRQGRPRRRRRAVPGATARPATAPSGAGGALSYGRAAPVAAPGQPLEQIGCRGAHRAGPDAGVRHQGPSTPAQLDSIVRYVSYLRHPDDPGGLSLGGIGPIPEGFLIWVLGIGLLLGAWLDRQPDPRQGSG